MLPFDFTNKIILAPLAGVTDSPYRRICKKFDVDIVCTEMLSADGIIRENAKTIEMFYFHNKERPISMQIFGSDPEIIAQATKIVSKYNPDLIDLNFGCPVKKVIKRMAGSALMRYPDRLQKIAELKVNATNIPVTAKIRCGWDNDSINAIEIAKRLEDVGIAAIIIHPRTRNQLFSEPSNWKSIKQIKQIVSIPVIGNGDIKTPEDAKRMFEETGCDAIMIGRAVLGNPFIFKRIRHYLDTGEILPEPSIKEKLEICKLHFEYMLIEKGEYKGIREMRKHIGWYTKGFRDGAQLRQRIFHLESKEEVIKALDEYLTNYGMI